MMGDQWQVLTFIFSFRDQRFFFQPLIVRRTEITGYPPMDINNTWLSGDGALFLKI